MEKACLIISLVFSEEWLFGTALSAVCKDVQVMTFQCVCSGKGGFTHCVDPYL